MGLFDRFKKKEEKKPKKEEKATSFSKPVVKKKPSGIIPEWKKEKKEKKAIELLASKTKIAPSQGSPAPKEKLKKVNKEDTGEAYRILLKPLLTEKATNLGMYGKYIFKVSPEVNKTEIKKAIHDLYGVKVVKVTIINQRGKEVRYGRSTGKTNDWKKAIITLKSGEKIEIYEGV